MKLRKLKYNDLKNIYFTVKDFSENIFYLCISDSCRYSNLKCEGGMGQETDLYLE